MKKLAPLHCVLVALALVSQFSTRSIAADPEKAKPDTTFAVGFGKRDITPKEPMPMWGYGARHAMLSQGNLDTMYAKAVVIQAGGQKLALVGLDLGRGPTQAMMEKIRAEIHEKAQIDNVLISGSHTHHGPCIELLDREGYGKGKFDAAVAYNTKLPDLLIEAILEADKNAVPAKIGVATKDVDLNRNRQTKRMPKATEKMLAVVRFDDEAGKPIAVLVNFAAHPVMTDGKILKFSADYPGFMQAKVEADMQTNCMFMQGSAGDMSVNSPAGVSGPKAFGEHLAGQVEELAKSAETKKPEKPSIQAKVDHFVFKSRVNFSNPLMNKVYETAFYPELVHCFNAEMTDGVIPELNTVLLNGDTALVGGSGEFFCNHSNRLKQRSYFPHTLFFGYCNGHNMYFPTIEAVSEGGYGADKEVSPVEVGAGEQIINQALINLYSMAGKIKDASTAPNVKAEK